MTNKAVIEGILEAYEVVQTDHLYKHEHDKEKLVAQLCELIVKARIEELEKAVRLWPPSSNMGWNINRGVMLKRIKELNSLLEQE